MGFLHGLCLMHKYWSCIMNALGMLNCFVPMFCATMFLRHSTQRSQIKRSCREVLRKKFRVKFGTYSGESTARVGNACLMKLLNLSYRYDSEDDIQAHGRRQARLEAQERLLQFIPVMWMPDGWAEHWCDGECGCTSEEDAFDKFMELVDLVYLSIAVTVPALNRWNTVLSCLTWWLFGFLFFGMLPAAFAQLRVDLSDDGIIGEATALGVSNDDGFRQFGAARYRKANGWVQQNWTGRRLSVASTVFLASAHMMGVCFSGAHCGSEHSSVLPFTNPYTSPAGTSGQIKKLT